MKVPLKVLYLLYLGCLCVVGAFMHVQLFERRLFGTAAA